MTRSLPWLLVPLAFVAGLAVQAKAPSGGVVSLADAPTRVAPSGKARVHLLTPHDTELGAFLAVLELDPGAKVPVHRDESAELLYVLEGGGRIWIDGQEHAVQAEDAVVMPPGAEVRFEGGDQKTRVVQVFAPAGSAAKYGGWPAQ